MIRLLALLSILTLTACATAPDPDQAPAAPFVLTEALAGETVGEGAFDPIFGEPRGFTAYLKGYEENGQFILEEDFVYDDGETDRKTWRFTPVSEGEWTGTREDVVGTARGYRDGDTFRLDYKVALGGRIVGFRDVLYLTPSGAVENKARVSWRGIPVGKVDLTITRR